MYLLTSTFFLCLFSKLVISEQCSTPENKEGQCVPLLECPEVMDAFANVRKGTENHLRKFICQTGEHLKVCCAANSSFKRPGDENSILKNLQAPPPSLDLQELFQCNTTLDSHLQVAEIRAINSGDKVEFTKCIGTLINPRYVLTAAECIVQNDVVTVQFQVNEKSERFDIEEKIPHQFYDITAGLYNIGLIRLNRTALQDENIHPRCLRSPTLVKLPTHGDDAISFGKTLTPSSSQLETIPTKLVSNDKCKETLQASGSHGTPTQHHLCTTDIGNSTTTKCTNLVGTPVFFPYNGPWLGGITSSKSQCGNGLPNMYTDVNTYFDWIFDNVKPWPLKNEQCTTIKGDVGNYMPLRYCPALFDTFANPKPGSEELLKKHIHDKENFIICCGSSPIDDAVNDQALVLSEELEKAKQYCGHQHQNDDFPWIAYLATRIPGEYEPDQPNCGGALITNRYVLTSASCLKIFQTMNFVQLGDFNLQRMRDCIEKENLSGVDCSRYINYGIEKKIIHPFDDGAFNNIALLRLNQTVEFSDVIKPICLPIYGKQNAKPNDILYASRFGFDQNGALKDLKLKVKTTLISNNDCRREQVKEYTIPYVNPLNMCTRDFSNGTDHRACGQDGGGPLMFQQETQWYAEGILQNIVNCRKSSVYTRVSRYLKWILDNIQP